MLGPIDYIAVKFEGNRFDGSILNELSKAVDSGAIRVVDLLFGTKDEDGDFAITEIEDEQNELSDMLGLDDNLPLLTEDDMNKLAESLDDDTSVGVLVVEQLWAKGLKKALLDAGGELIDEGRIHPEVVKDAVEEIETAK